MKDTDATKEFYETLGVKSLSKLTTSKKTKTQLCFLKKYLSKKQRILDLACGYGRLTIPLAQEGFTIEGLDLSPYLIKNAKKCTQQKKLNITFKTGDMRNLPYKNSSFDAVFCMWSSFNELLTKKDQIQTLNEIFRVLKMDGIGIIDVPYFNKPTMKLKKVGTFIQKSSHLYKRVIEGLEVIRYLHNKESLLNIAKKSKITNHTIKVITIEGKRRIIFYFYK